MFLSVRSVYEINLVSVLSFLQTVLPFYRLFLVLGIRGITFLQWPLEVLSFL